MRKIKTERKKEPKQEIEGQMNGQTDRQQTDDRQQLTDKKLQTDRQTKRLKSSWFPKILLRTNYREQTSCLKIWDTN